MEESTNGLSPVSFWQTVDAVLVINLDQRQDRWEEFQTQAASVVPPEKLHRVSAVFGRDLPGFGERPWFRGAKRDGTWAARGGCVLSHRRALQLAHDSGWETVLVLEDDVSFRNDFDQLAPALEQALSQHKDRWEICYLAFADPLPPYRRLGSMGSNHSLHQVFGCNSAYAYLVKPRARDWILKNLPETGGIWRWLARHRAVDRWYRRSLGRRFGVFCVSPGIIEHAPGFSDILGRPCDYFAGDDYVTVVPTKGEAARTFRLWSKWQHFRTCMLDKYDAFRGWIKKLKGF